VRADLLAVPAQDVDGRLKPTPILPGARSPKGRRSLVEIASVRLLDGPSGEALGIGLHYGVTRELNGLVAGACNGRYLRLWSGAA
jgi:hypothetical protein